MARRTSRLGGQAGLVDVGFRFPDAARRSGLRHVDANVEPGETVAMVGATGSGKTTLTALVSRLYDVTAGGIRSTASTSAT